MTDDRRNKLAAIVAEGDQNNAHYRDWLQSLDQAELDEVYAATVGLHAVCEVTPTSPAKLGTLGVIAMARHALCAEMTRRAELEVGGEG